MPPLAGRVGGWILANLLGPDIWGPPVGHCAYSIDFSIAEDTDLATV